MARPAAGPTGRRRGPGRGTRCSWPPDSSRAGGRRTRPAGPARAPPALSAAARSSRSGASATRRPRCCRYLCAETAAAPETPSETRRAAAAGDRHGAPGPGYAREAAGVLVTWLRHQGVQTSIAMCTSNTKRRRRWLVPWGWRRRRSFLMERSAGKRDGAVAPLRLPIGLRRRRHDADGPPGDAELR
jgi:hypothetical protein